MRSAGPSQTRNFSPYSRHRRRRIERFWRRLLNCAKAVFDPKSCQRPDYSRVAARASTRSISPPAGLDFDTSTLIRARVNARRISSETMFGAIKNIYRLTKAGVTLLGVWCLIVPKSVSLPGPLRRMQGAGEALPPRRGKASACRWPSAPLGRLTSSLANSSPRDPTWSVRSSRRHWGP